MMRLMASAAATGALIAACAWYAANGSTRSATIAGELGAAREAAAAADVWPICTTMTDLGTESDWAQLDPDFAAGKRALAGENWNRAITALKLAFVRDPKNADIQNYLGYAYWRLRQMGPAMGHYQQALALSPRHRRARVHLGELYLALDEPTMAEEQLAVLRDICLLSCGEISELEYAIATHRATAQGRRSAPAL
jgi:Flp pilus assembly protein TadD